MCGCRDDKISCVRGCDLATELSMPQMGYDMQEGTVVRWLISEGDEVKVGDAIAEIETDKAVVEFESTSNGVLRRIVVPEGTTLPVGQTIAIVGTPDEELPEAVAEASTAPPPAPTPETPDISVAAAPAEQEGAPVPVGEVRASPVARRLAQERGIDLTQVKGTGPGGRITKSDVLSVEPSERPEAVAEAPPALPAAPPPPASGEKVALTRMRQQIARVTVKSKQEIPHFYVSSEINMTRAMALRQQINDAVEHEGVRVSVNDMIIKASVGALKSYPKFNSSFAGDAIQMIEPINIGIAIAQEEGLILPAVMDCGGKSLSQISAASKDLIERSNGGTLRPQEYAGGTFSISNLGMFDVSSFAAIIQPPQSAVLAVGKVLKRPAVEDGGLTVADMMTATLSVDHRVADGAEGARFLVEVKRLLESPLSLLV